MRTETADLIAAARALIEVRHAASRQAPEIRAFDRLTLATDAAADALLDAELTAERLPTEQVPTYHGITYAQCFACGYGTADTTTLEVWNDLGGDCPKCATRVGRVLWVLTGGRVTITETRPDDSLDVRPLRLGDEHGTPPDAEATS